MEKLTKSDIEEINKGEGFDSWLQGIYSEPYGIPNDIKEPVIYKRWSAGGMTGGSCWDDSENYPFDGDSEPDFVVLERALQKICPTLSFLHFKEIERLIVSSLETEYEYYGNYNEWEMKFLPLSVLYKKLEQLGY